MAQRGKSGIVEQLVLLIVILVPLAGIVAYLLNENGFFNASSSAPAPAAQTVPQTTQPAPSSAATLIVDDPTALPTTVTAGEIVPFSFTMQNTGDSDATYQYKVSVTWNSGEQDVIDVNSISLAKGESKSIPESLKFETTPATADILIQVEPSGPSIHLTLPHSN